MDDKEYPCPCCGFLMFGGPPGTYEICQVCGWEDDPVQLRFPAMGGGANKLSLAQSQARILLRVDQAVLVFGGFRRAHGWRPLGPGDVATPDSSPSTGLQYFEAACEDSALYYWQRGGAP